jgi:hypothetical protein
VTPPAFADDVMAACTQFLLLEHLPTALLETTVIRLKPSCWLTPARLRRALHAVMTVVDGDPKPPQFKDALQTHERVSFSQVKEHAPYLNIQNPTVWYDSPREREFG